MPSPLLPVDPTANHSFTALVLENVRASNWDSSFLCSRHPPPKCKLYRARQTSYFPHFLNTDFFQTGSSCHHPRRAVLDDHRLPGPDREHRPDHAYRSRRHLLLGPLERHPRGRHPGLLPESEPARRPFLRTSCVDWSTHPILQTREKL